MKLLRHNPNLDPWPFDLGTGTECQWWHRQPSCRFWCFCDFSSSSYGQTCVKL